MNIIDNGDHFKILIDYGPRFKEQVAFIKSLHGSTWDNKTRFWNVPNLYRNEILNLEKTEGAKVLVAENTASWLTGELPPLPDLDIDTSNILKVDLRPYQRQGVAQGLQLKKFINGDEQGLGKTFQSIATLSVAKSLGEDVFPCLVICPSSTKVNWMREWEKFSHFKAMILDDKTLNTWHKFYEIGMKQVFIVNYESLRKFFVLRMPSKTDLKESKDIELRPVADLFKSVIVDEIHRCKDSTTIQSKICLRMAVGRTYRIALTGTPVVNKPADLWPQLAIIGQLENMGGKKYFLQRYCDGGKGANNLKELNHVLNHKCFFRREKKDVAKDLPEKQRQTIICEITTRKEYLKAKNELDRWLRENGFTDGQINKAMKGEAIVRMNKLRQISAMGKLDEAEEFTREVLDGGNKLILFCNMHAVVDEMLKRFPGAVTVTGRDDMNQRQRSIDLFQKDPKVKLIICNIKAAGVGITLTASSRVAFIEFPWTYADCAQCEDRAHRIGQTNNVMCTYFLGQDTIDERIYELIQEKKQVANAITGGTDEMEMKMVDRVLSILD